MLKGSSIDLYFYNKDELQAVSLPVTVLMEYPEKAGTVSLIKVDFELADGTSRMVSFNSGLSRSEFPLEIDVPFSWGSTLTKMTVYVNDMTNAYELRYVERTEEQMVPTPTPTETPYDTPDIAED